MSKLDTYKNAAASLPETYKAWQIFGAGLENVGKDDQPLELPLREPNDNEILLRVDALGICLSDIKIINQGGNHARLRGRDLEKEPTVLGHECSATVVKVGKNWEGQFSPGQRFIVQADIYSNGIGYAFGYVIPGGMGEYTYLDERALAGDEGCYLLPVRAETGYSQAALAEPWACVEMSYCLEDRLAPSSAKPLIVTQDAAKWSEKFPEATVESPSLDKLTGTESFDDIIIDGVDAQTVQALAPKLNKKGVMFLLGAGSGSVSLDVGGIHYEDKRFLGGGESLEAIAQANLRADLKPGGLALFIGAGGPMGQMHVQRALEKADGPQRVVVTDLDRGRLDHIVHLFQGLADARGAELITLAGAEFASPAEMDAKIASLAPQGYDDIVILAPVAALVSGTMKFAAPGCLVNVFAGLVVGTMANIPLEKLCQGVKIIGSSGSRIRDLRRILELVEGGDLDTNRSVAAIGGLSAAKDGLKAVKEARFPGKTVIYTEIPELPLMSLKEAAERIPELQGKLSPEGAWTKAAEQALLEKYLN